MTRSRHTTTAHWEDDNLMIGWFGMSPDYAACWDIRRGQGVLVFEGLSESKAWKLDSKPSAEEALALIINWQNVR